VLTTQLYFPNEPNNATDGIYNSSLEVTTTDAPDAPEGMNALFNFVLAI
jgi:hypothetical protein